MELWQIHVDGRFHHHAPSEEIATLGIGPGPVRSVVDVEWALGWIGALQELIGELRAAIDEDELRNAGVPAGTDPTAGLVDRQHGGVGEVSIPGSNGDGGTPGTGMPASGPPVASQLPAVELLQIALEDLSRLLAARKVANRSLLWGLGEHLFTQLDEIRTRLASIRKQKEDAETEASEVDENETKTKKSKRRALLRLFLILLALVAVGVGAFVGIFYAALSTATVILLGAGVALLWLVACALAVWRCVRSWFLIEHRQHWLRQGRVEVLEQAILFEDAQCRRFTYLFDAARDWSDLIATICYHPFRRPTIDAFQRVREPDLGLTSSFQVVEGHTTEPRLEGVTSSVAAELIRPGWLSTTFHSALEFAKEEHNLRTRGGSFQPDEDVSGLTDRLGARGALVDATVSGRARQRREIEVLSRIHEKIRTGIGFKQNPTEMDQAIEDRLFTPWADKMAPSRFLDEPVEGSPSNFNREFIPIAAIPTRLASAAKQDVALPDPPTIEGIIEGVNIDFPPLVFSSWAIETATGVDTSVLAFFGSDVSAVELDLEVARTRWIPPPDECLGTISVRPLEDRDAWVLDGARLARLASHVTANPDTQPAASRGAYRFTIQQDGEPLVHPAGLPIKYAVRSDVAPPGADDMIARAFQAVADRTGYEFVFDGTFKGLPRNHADRIEVAWAFDDEFQEWERSSGKSPGMAIGWGGPSWVGGELGQKVLSGGLVLLNADMDYEVGYLPGGSHGKVLLHELGHAMNLSHVDDAREIMRPGGFPLQPHLDYGPGDSMGLRYLRSSSLRRMASTSGDRAPL